MRVALGGAGRCTVGRRPLWPAAVSLHLPPTGGKGRKWAPIGSERHPAWFAQTNACTRGIPISCDIKLTGSLAFSLGGVDRPGYGTLRFWIGISRLRLPRDLADQTFAETAENPLSGFCDAMTVIRSAVRSEPCRRRKRGAHEPEQLAKAALCRALCRIQAVHRTDEREAWKLLVEFLAVGLNVHRANPGPTIDETLVRELRSFVSWARAEPGDYLGWQYSVIHGLSGDAMALLEPWESCQPLLWVAPCPIAILDTCLGTGRRLLTISLAAAHQPLILLGVERERYLYRAALVNFHLFSKHTFFLKCGDPLGVDPSPWSESWRSPNAWT